MTRSVVALLVSVSLLGCFPHNKQARTYAQLGEGAAILAGIAISALAKTSADCDEMSMAGIDDSSCHSQARWLSTGGMVLIVGGLLGFVATVSTAEDAEKAKVVEIKETTAAKPESKPEPTAPAATTPAATQSDNTQATDPDAAGSGSSAASAPQH